MNDMRSATPLNTARLGRLTAAVVLALGLLTLPTTLTEGDGAEWLIIGRYGGIAHPPGYPLYALICRLFALAGPPLPLVTALALASILASALAAWFSYRALVELEVAPLAACAATLVVFGSAVVWRVNNMVEPFALNLTLAAAVLFCASRAVRLRQQRDVGTGHRGRLAFALGALFGLGFCNHHSLVWLVPVGVVGLHAAADDWRGRIGRFAGGFALGLLPLAYFSIGQAEDAPHTLYRVDDAATFVRFLLRSNYGTFRLAGHEGTANLGSLAHFGVHLPMWLSGIFVAIALWGCADLLLGWRRRPRPEHCVAAALALSFLLSTVLFLGLFNVEVRGWIPSIIERFMALPVLLLALPIGKGLERATEVAPTLAPRWRTVAMFTAVLAHVTWQSRAANRFAETFYEDHVRAVFAALPAAGNTLLTASDAEIFAVYHGRDVLGLATPDFRWLNAALWKNEKRRPEMVAAWGLPAQLAQLSLTGVVGRLAAERGRVAVVDLPAPPRPTLFAHAFPLGPLVVVVATDAALPDAAELWSMNRTFFEQLTWPTCAERQRFTAWNRALWQKYLDGSARLATALDEHGAPGLAAEARRLHAALGECVAPWPDEGVLPGAPLPADVRPGAKGN